MQRIPSSVKRFFVIGLMVFCGLTPNFSRANDTDYEPPTDYYTSAAGLTGSALKSQLTTIMSNGFVARSYGDLRYADAILDADPNHAGNILLIYNRASVSSTWDSGSTWSREHLWPVSLLGTGDPTNSAKSMESDEFLIRPINPSVNSSRSNYPYGTTTSSGVNGYQASGYYYPGDADRGDVARSIFYAVTRYPSFNGHNLSLVPGIPSTYQMGDLNALIHWNYLDVPDAFERRRNQAVYSSTMNPSYYQGNRNAYIDHPEYVWSAFVDQANDTQITTDTTLVDLGRVLVGSSLGTQSVTILKTGVDGTYYEVRTSGSATSTVSGRYNAFPMDTTGSKVMTVGLNASTATAGLKSGTVTVDNLDITTQGGAGKGGNDPDDIVTVSAAVLDHAIPSLSGPEKTTSLVLDFGTFPQNSGTHALAFTLYNQTQTAGYTAKLNLDSVAASGNADVFSTTLAPFSNLEAGDQKEFIVSLDTAVTGTFSRTYSLTCSDENIPGARTFSLLTVTATGTVEPAIVPLTPGDANGDGRVDVGDLGILAANYGVTAGATWAMGDFNGDQKVDVGDLGILAAHYGSGTVASPDFNKDARALGLTVNGNETAKNETPPASTMGCGSAGLPLMAGLLWMSVLLPIAEERYRN